MRIEPLEKQVVREYRMLIGRKSGEEGFAKRGLGEWGWYSLWCVLGLSEKIEIVEWRQTGPLSWLNSRDGSDTRFFESVGSNLRGLKKDMLLNNIAPASWPEVSLC